MSLLSVENLSLSIHGNPILKGISFSLEPGKILGIIGESGSGKSLTAYSIMQLLPNGSRTSGDITFEGQKLLTASEEQMCGLRGNDISMIFQEPMTALNPVMTIGDQVAESAVQHGKFSQAEAMDAARVALARAELPEERFPLNRFPHELSGGQRQRVMIAMAIVMQPKLIIADEPTTALDVTTQAQILDLLKKLVVEDGMAMMLITHDLAVVSNMADDLCIMKDGEIVETGSTASLLQSLKHPYSRQLWEASGHVPDRDTNPAGEQTSLLKVDRVCRDYRLPRKSLFESPGTFRAVDAVSFSIQQGESVGLVGESGCGKSTLMRTILGIDPIAEGSIQLNGQSVFSGKRVDRSVRRNVQAVFQDPYGSFNPRHRVSRLVTEPMYLLDHQPGREEKQDAIAEALTSVGLEPSDASKYIHEFSGGQRQRIAIARALIIKPALIVLDEATSALDVSIRAQILDLLAELSERYRLSYLFIAHDLSVVRSITDRVLVMSRGKIVEQGETETVFNSPQHAYTQSLLAAAPKLPELEEV